MNNEKKNFYKKYPDIFLEDFFDIKLFWWQRFYIRHIVKSK
jgi:hypothetical protein